MSVPSVKIACQECGAFNYVLVPTRGQQQRPEDADAPEGAGVVVADWAGRFICAQCGAQNEAPGLLDT